MIVQCSTIGIAEKLESINPSQLRFREIVATRTSVPPIIDGIIDDEVWENAKIEMNLCNLSHIICRCHLKELKYV